MLVQIRHLQHEDSVPHLALQCREAVLVAPRHNLVAVAEADAELPNRDDFPLGELRLLCA